MLGALCMLLSLFRLEEKWETGVLTLYNSLLQAQTAHWSRLLFTLLCLCIAASCICPDFRVAAGGGFILCALCREFILCGPGCLLLLEAPEWVLSQLLSRVQLFLTLWTVAYQAPLSMGFSRQECWSELLFPSPGHLPDSGIEPTSPVSPALQADSLPAETLGKPHWKLNPCLKHIFAFFSSCFWKVLLLTLVDMICPSEHLQACCEIWVPECYILKGLKDCSTEPLHCTQEKTEASREQVIYLR